jgi:adenine-specific DNA methylase
MTTRLIEEWLPIAALGEESVRERTPMTPFPAPNRLHVWWARRPLVAARAAILASLLPADADRDRFMHVLGIHGNPVATRRRIDMARQHGERFEGEAYDYKRAFSYSMSQEERDWLAYETGRIGVTAPRVLDPTAGGGSIPFEAIRLGVEALANDFNPVAALILRHTVEIPLICDLSILSEFERLAAVFMERRESALTAYFPQEPRANAIPTNFIWARTCTCPYCDGLIPLSPNWKLASDGTGVRLLPRVADGPGSPGRVCDFEIVTQAREQSSATMARGSATCPYPDCGRVVDGDAVKQQAQAGQMGEQLYAIVYKEHVLAKTRTGKSREKWVRGYRAPRPEDDVTAQITEILAEKLPEWEALDMVPTEAIIAGSKTDEPRRYGMSSWRDLFSFRQLLCHGTSVEVFRELLEVEQARSTFSEVTKAAFGYLVLSLDKLRDYNSRMTRWHSNREVMVNTFDRHDFAFKWSYAEMAPLIVGLGYDWAIKQTAKCLRELIELVRPDINVKAHVKKSRQADLFTSRSFTPPSVTITCKSADNLDHLADGSIDVVVIDPPYYSNVMYAELSDFFYVWLKRTAGYLYPELFRRQLTDKDNEAVANPTKFRGQPGAQDLADQDYRERMAAIFAECRRVLKADGIMTLMFTHKATGAWDALTTGLMEAGFMITASWPINTEAEGSLHIKDKAAANSTIFLVCRPRLAVSADAAVLYWEDLEPRVRKAVSSRIHSFQEAGIKGVDLYLACFGPALEEFSRHWPVRRGQPRLQTASRRRGQADLLTTDDPYSATPEDALNTARHEVKRWRLEQLTTMQRQQELDALTEWFVLAWDAFKAPQFPSDEALRLARVVGVALDRDIIGRLAEKKASTVILWDSATRAAKGVLGPADGSHAMLDAIHHAAHSGRQRSLDAARDLLVKSGVASEPRFLAALEAVLEVLPPSRTFTGFDPDAAVAPAAQDFDVLEHLRRLAFTDQIDAPEQLHLWDATP